MACEKEKHSPLCDKAKRESGFHGGNEGKSVSDLYLDVKKASLYGQLMYDESDSSGELELGH